MLLPAPSDDLCLAFANTRYWRGSATQVEQLGDVAALLDWAAKSGGAAAETVKDLRRLARANEAKGAKLFAEAIALREVIYRIFSAPAAGAHAREPDLAALNRAIAESPARVELARANGGYRWHIERASPTVATLLAPVLWSAADLLATAAQAGVRRCANDKCLWLFLDNSKNGTRRWCDMNACGNRAKAHRHYLKMKQG